MVLNIFKRKSGDSVESKFREMYLDLVSGVFDFRKILKGVPLCFVDDLPLTDINPDWVYVIVRGCHPYYDLKYYRFIDDDEGEWVELDLVGVRGLIDG